jgi:hypothetical protein
MTRRACRRSDDGTPCPACSDARLRTDDLETCFHSLRALVDAMAVRRSIYAIIETGHPHRYVQVLADRDGALLVEASSNEATAHGRDSAGLDPLDELELLRLRYLPPDDFSPNWHRVLPDPWPWPAPLAAALLLRTLTDVLGAAPSELRLRVHHALPRVSVVRP